MSFHSAQRNLELPAALTEALLTLAVEMAKHSAKAFRIERPSLRRGKTLRPGSKTPLWNELRKELRTELKRYGDQARLGRLLALPRQRVQAYVTRGTEMPDAERTLQMLAWLMATRQGRPPS
ncbi:hypothetical protein [Oleiharenicola lentus]|uniref:hypothetical protein n=1 Tax=Oleiharenicola lentus TaxID=2508720 RepID=UPI003F661FBA